MNRRQSFCRCEMEHLVLVFARVVFMLAVAALVVGGLA